MIGMLYTAAMQFYDNKNNRMAYKGRPVMIIGQADESDYIILPVSRVTQRQHLSAKYDFKIDPAVYTFSGLSCISYVRTHKQMIINKGQLSRAISDFRREYPKEYKSIINLVDEFQKEMIEASLSL